MLLRRLLFALLLTTMTLLALPRDVEQPDLDHIEEVWRSSELFLSLREPQTGGACRSCGFYDSCQGGCMAAKFFTGLPLDGPDPECVQGYGEYALAAAGPVPRSPVDHSRPLLPLSVAGKPRDTVPDRACDVSPLAGLSLA